MKMKIEFNKRVLLLFSLFVFAFFLRFMLISKGPFHCDTLDLALTAQKTLETKTLHYEHGTGYPLTVICAAFFIFIFRLFNVSDPVFCVNFMSVLAGSVSVVLLYLVVKKLFEGPMPWLPCAPVAAPSCGSSQVSRDGDAAFRKAFFSAFLLACFMPHVAISTFGKSLTLSICFILASSYYMLLYTQCSRHSHLIYSAVFLGFCTAARLSDVIICVPIVYLYFSGGKNDYAKIKHFIVFSVVSVFCGLIYYCPMLLENGIEQFSEVWHSYGGAQYIGIFSDVFKYNVDWMKAIFSAAGTTLFLAGFGYMIVRKLYRPFVFLILWFLVTFFFYAGISSSGPRYLVIAWIPLLIAQGSFLGDLKKHQHLVLLLLLFMVCQSFSENARALEFRHRYALQEEFASWVGVNTEPDARIIAMDEGIFIEYYAKRKVIYRPVFETREQTEAFFKEIDGFLDKKGNVYIIGSAYMTYDAGGYFQKKLFNRYDMVLLGWKKNEDWHHALLNQGFLDEKLYKVQKKAGAPHVR